MARAMASAPAAFRVRVWQITSRGRRATGEATAACPRANVDHPHPLTSDVAVRLGDPGESGAAWASYGHFQGRLTFPAPHKKRFRCTMACLCEARARSTARYGNALLLPVAPASP